MTTIRVIKNPDNPYVMIDKNTIQDNKLSWKAKGLLAYLLSLPDDWIIYVSELSKHAPDGEASLRSGMRELEAAGYLVKEQDRAADGTFGGYNYTVNELPNAPYGEKPHTVYPHADNRRLLSTNSTNNNSTNIKREGNSENFDTLLEIIERYTGVMQTQQDIKAIQEMEQLGIIEEDIASAVKFFSDAGKTARGAKHLLNSARYNLQKRVQADAVKNIPNWDNNNSKADKAQAIYDQLRKGE